MNLADEFSSWNFGEMLADDACIETQDFADLKRGLSRLLQLPVALNRQFPTLLIGSLGIVESLAPFAQHRCTLFIQLDRSAAIKMLKAVLQVLNPWHDFIVKRMERALSLMMHRTRP
jgi:hypothetical protein